MNKLAEFISGLQPEVQFIKPTMPNQAVRTVFSTFYVEGIPRAGVFPSSDDGTGIALTSHVQGQLSMINAGSGLNTYLANLIIQADTPGTWILCDRLWHNKIQSPTSTSEQTINSVAFPSRDDNQSTNGKGVSLGLELAPSTALGAGNRTLTITYTNSDSVSGKTAIHKMSSSNSYPVGCFLPFSMTEPGVSSIQTYQQSSSMGTTNISLVAYRVLATLPVRSSGLTSQYFIPSSINLVNGGIPKVFNDSVLFLLYIPTQTAQTPVYSVYGALTWTIA